MLGVVEGAHFEKKKININSKGLADTGTRNMVFKKEVAKIAKEQSYYCYFVGQTHYFTAQIQVRLLAQKVARIQQLKLLRDNFCNILPRLWRFSHRLIRVLFHFFTRALSHFFSFYVPTK